MSLRRAFKWVPAIRCTCSVCRPEHSPKRRYAFLKMASRSSTRTVWRLRSTSHRRTRAPHRILPPRSITTKHWTASCFRPATPNASNCWAMVPCEYTTLSRKITDVTRVWPRISWTLAKVHQRFSLFSVSSPLVQFSFWNFQKITLSFCLETFFSWNRRISSRFSAVFENFREVFEKFQAFNHSFRSESTRSAWWIYQLPE